MKRLLWLLPACVLSSCLLNQNDPVTQSAKVKPYLLGAVSVEHLTISNAGSVASISAEFAIKPEDKTTPTPVAASLASSLGRQVAVRELFGTAAASRGPMCKKKIIDTAAKPDTKEAAVAPAATPLSRISVGKVAFGPALQATFMELNVDKNLRYTAALNTSIPAGLYQLEASGAGSVDAFGQIISFPEEIRSFRMNGMDFGNPTMLFNTSKSLELYWREAGITNDQNGILTEVIVKEGDKVYDLACGIREEDIPTVSGYKVWNIDSAWLSEMPKTGKAEFYFIRAHFRSPVAKREKMQLQGARTFYSAIPIGS